MANPVTRPKRNHQDGFTLTIPLSSAFNAYPTCTVTVDTNANMADGNIVTIDDGFRKVVYEYDKSANGVVAGRVAWAAGAGTAAQSAATLATAIAANQSCLTVVDNTDGTLTLTNKFPGVTGNTTNSCTSVGTLAITNFAGGNGVTGIKGTSTFKAWPKIGQARAIRISHASINSIAGFVQDASNYWTITLQDGATVLASWSTQTGAQGTLTANTPAALVVSATHTDLVSGDVLSLVFTPTGTPANFPLPATLSVEGLSL